MTSVSPGIWYRLSSFGFAAALVCREHVNRSYVVVVLAVLVVAAVPSSAFAIACDDSVSEKRVLTQAPHGAKRTSRHTLSVDYLAGTKTFVDKPPHEELSGLHWSYCGYDPKAKAHLISKQDESLFSGVLLYDDTGKLVPAGHTVLFSPSLGQFLAIEQEDGVDGESWSLRDASGAVEWSGYAGVAKTVGGIETVVSTLDHPRWDARGGLTATSTCEDGSHKSGAATLVQANGVWLWRSDLRCGP